MKYIIDIPDGIAKASKEFWKKSTGMDLVPYTESDRNAIENEVWDFARGLLYYTDENWESLIDLLLVEKASYQEAKAKYDAWKSQKEEIHVGDEVIPMDTKYDTMIVTRTWKDDYSSDCVDTIGFDGSIGSFLTSKVKKTGRHFDEVEELLKKMKEE